jgi:hypothetical protein
MNRARRRSSHRRAPRTAERSSHTGSLKAPVIPRASAILWLTVSRNEVASMSTALIVFLIVIAVLAGITVTLKTSANKGMPSADVLHRAAERSRELDAKEKAEEDA